MLDLADIQGNILRGYRSFKMARFLYFTLSDAAEVRAGIAAVLENRLITAGDWGDDRPEATANIAFSFAGLCKLRLPADSLASFPPEFQVGMETRAASLGDVGESAPGHWEGHWKDRKVELLIMIYAADLAAIAAKAKLINHALGTAVTLLASQDCAALPGGHEHFGFRDGLSNPDVAGVPRTDQSFRSPRKNRRGQAVPVAAGEFILGQPDEGGEIGTLPIPHLLVRNGTFLVVRKLHQRVWQFRDFVTRQTNELHRAQPQDAPRLSEEFLAAKIVGRWPDGTPLTLSPHAPSGNPRPETDFSYAADPHGARCPLGAHIRRANPRDALGFNGKLVDRHRLIRRSIPYGLPLPNGANDEADRGLMFLGFNASIARQFEFIQQNWINFGDAAGQGNDKDPLLGSHDGTGRMLIPGDERSERRPFICTELPRFVTVRGGEYFFVPSLTALRVIATNGVYTA
jgi:Dyp-type peroxidase family